MEKNNNIPENENDVNFSAEQNIVPVAAAETKNKNLPTIIIICVLVLAIAIGSIIYFVKSNNSPLNGSEHSTDDDSWDEQQLLDYFNSQISAEDLTDADGASISKEEYLALFRKKLQEATTTLNADMGKKSPLKITENTTAPITQGVTAANTANNDKAQTQIKAFFNLSFHFTGAMYSGNEGNPMKISFDGSDMEVLTNLDGVELSILSLDGKLYFKRPATKQYAALTEEFCKIVGFSTDNIVLNFGNTSYEDMQKKFVGSYDVTVDGKEGVCYQYANTDRVFKFYTVDGEIKQIHMTDANNTAETVFYISSFSPSIPADQLTLKGYTEANMMVMFADVFSH